MNIQFAVKKEDGRPNVYVLEVNPRASRTVPFVSKATGMPVAKIAAKVMAGVSLAELGCHRASRFRLMCRSRRACSRSASSPASTSCSGPRCVRTGEVMGVSERFSIAFAKSQLAAGVVLPESGNDVHQRGRRGTRGTSSTWPASWPISASNLLATEGTARLLQRSGHRGQAGQEAPGRASQPARLPDRRRSDAGHEHAQRQRRPHRRGPYPRGRRLSTACPASPRSRRRGRGGRHERTARRRDDGPGAARSAAGVSERLWSRGKGVNTWTWRLLVQALEKWPTRRP